MIHGHARLTAITDSDGLCWALRRLGLQIADYFALSRARFAARAWLQTNLLCVLGEVISEREAELVHGV